MPRPRRVDEAGRFYQALNRGHGRSPFFLTDDDDSAFERILAVVVAEYDVLVFSFPLIPNHWHLLLRPNVDGEMVTVHGSGPGCVSESRRKAANVSFVRGKISSIACPRFREFL